MCERERYTSDTRRLCACVKSVAIVATHFDAFYHFLRFITILPCENIYLNNNQLLIKMSSAYSRSVYCILCGNRKKSVSYHAFPKQEEIRKQWIAFCGIDEYILNTATRLCSDHFCEEMKKKMTKGVGLKPNAVPSIHETQEMPEQSNSALIEVFNSAKHKDIATDNLNIHCNVLVTDTPLIVDIQCAPQSYENVQLLQCQTPPKVTSQSCVSHIKTPDSSPKAKRLLQVVNSGPSTPARDKSTLYSNWQTPTKTLHDPRFVSEISTPHLATPRKAQRALQLAKWTIAQQRRKIKTLQQARNRLVVRVTTMKELIKHLKKKNLLSEAAAEHLQAEIPDAVNHILKRKKSTRKKYSAELRSFALTLNFYSSKAYSYVRKTFRNLLPEPSTIRKWYSVLDGRPGFTNEILIALKCKVRNTDVPIFCNLILDEIAIRQQIIYDGNRYYGYVDLGVNNSINDSDNPPQAKSALVFMVVALNSHWKVPLGYFLIDSLSGKERASLLEKSLELLYDTGVILHSLTFDGCSVNISMCTNLGANFELDECFKPYILHPITKEKIFCFLDPCHALKLVRNTLGDKLVLRHNDNKIYWDHIVSLQKIQEGEGLKAATKLTKKHIMYKNHKMNVKLAAQTLSASVSAALQFANKYFPMQFNVPKETALFCTIFNDAFDMLNVRS